MATLINTPPCSANYIYCNSLHPSPLCHFFFFISPRKPHSFKRQGHRPRVFFWLYFFPLPSLIFKTSYWTCHSSAGGATPRNAHESDYHIALICPHCAIMHASRSLHSGSLRLPHSFVFKEGFFGGGCQRWLFIHPMKLLWRNLFLWDTSPPCPFQLSTWREVRRFRFGR